MKGRTPTKEEAQWMSVAQQVGCMACWEQFNFQSPICAVHHIEGKTKPGAHLLTIGLCDRHHQHPDNQEPKRWISRHGDGRKAFAREYGSEYELLHQCRQAALDMRLIAKLPELPDSKVGYIQTGMSGKLA